MTKIHALLVGINDYTDPIKSLHGCVNDVDHFEYWLRHNVQPGDLALEVLKNGDASYANVVRQFREHLVKRAQPGDVAVFQYCGHGAQYGSAEEFRGLDSEGLDEGLVLADSRHPPPHDPQGTPVYDLADKELAVLIGEVAKRDVHVTFILDSCHSGSATRSADAFNGLRSRLVPRQATPGEPVRRPLETYLDGHFAQRKRERQPLRDAPGRHILLAACSRGEEAKESHLSHRGIFSATLMEVLESTGGKLSYADLFVRCRAAVRKRATSQNPQFEPIGGFDPWSGFLGGVTASRSHRHTVFLDGAVWKLNAGAIHGLDHWSDRPVGLALYDGTDASRSAGTAHTIAVGPQESTVAFDTKPPSGKDRYEAEVTSMPVSPLLVHCTDTIDDAQVQTWQQALDGAGAALAAAGVLLTREKDGVRYALEVESAELLLVQRESGRVLQSAPLSESDTPKQWLRTIAGWERVAALQNSSPRIDGSKVEFVGVEVGDDGAELPHRKGSLTVESAQRQDGKWSEPRVLLKARNRCGVTLYPVLVYLQPDYGIDVWPTDELKHNETWVTLWGDARSQVFRLEKGLEHEESIDRFKLILSVTPVDGYLLKQSALGRQAASAPVKSRVAGSAEEDELKPRSTDWLTRDLRVRVVPRANAVGEHGWKSAGDAVVVKPHSRLRAQLNLVPALPATRGPGELPAFIAAFERAGLSVASLGSRGDTRSTTDDHGVIELSDIRNAETLADEPLQIEIRQKLNANEALLPFAFDGEHVLPCGQVTRRDDGDTQVTQVTLDHLPETPSDRRSVGGSLKLYFFKTYLKNNDVNRLRWIKFKKDGSWEYHKDEKNDEDTVRGQVAAAERVLLLVHGWIGDTEGMAAGVAALGLRHHFDLVLAYDYENLSTPIADTARTLKRDLADVGLRDGDGKHLTLLVHSMGGLVSRWFIEHEGGNAVVDHLVMCGTPNFGSPFGHVDEARKLLVVLLGLAANYMPGQVHWIALVQLLLNRSQKVTPTLEQMNPGHDFITKLNDSEDPGIPYTIVAGNVREYREPTDALFAKLLAKVGQSVLFDALFAQKANDIAVAVDSIRRVTPRRVSPPEVVNVNCHHLNYFVSEVGQQALRRVAW